MVRDFRWLGSVVLGMLMVGVVDPQGAGAQISKSEALASELSALLDQAKLGAVAARDPETKDEFVAALYFSGRQLLVVAARYESPSLLMEQLAEKAYREIYTDLQSASIPDSKVFVDDLSANGLKAVPGENEAFDTFTEPAGAVSFNGNWQDQGMSETEYTAAFGKADAAYSHMLSLLIAELKKSS